MTIISTKNNSALEIASRSLKIISEEAASLQRILLSIASEGSSDLSEEDFNEIIQEKLAKFFNLSMEQAKKFDGLYWAYKAIEAEKKALKERFRLINEMQASLLQSYDRSLDGIKNYLLFLHSKKLIDDKNIGNRSTITIYDSPPSVQEILTDIEELPEKFKRTKVEPDKKAIINAYKQGRDVSKYASINTTRTIRFGIIPKSKNKNK
ncbi:MAG: siphovirus Gp157 family protein [Cyanobacteria bacterium P01_A01_bin.84]